jgi:hypothetical protein
MDGASSSNGQRTTDSCIEEHHGMNEDEEFARRLQAAFDSTED